MRVALLAVLFVTVIGPPRPSTEARARPFRLHRGHLVLVQGSIGPLRDLLLLIDTGAARTIVAKAVADKIGLKGNPTNLHAFGLEIAAEEAVLPNLDLGAQRVVTQSVLVTDLAGTAASLQLPRLDGIIGIDILRRTSFAIDYLRRQLQFDSRVGLSHRARFVGQTVLPLIAALADGTRVRLIVDSGASHVALFGYDKGRESSLSIEEQAARLGGTTSVRPVLLGRLEIGKWRRDGVVALVLDRSANEPMGADGVLGLPALGASFVQFDFVSQELGWKH